jgi:hypothetical protein
MRYLFLSALFSCFLAAPLTTALSAPLQTDIDHKTVRQITTGQMTRYARELYLGGHYSQAADAFKRILELECSNKLAQYHLQKIATAAPGATIAEETLGNLPCEQLDFNQVDFVSASVFYEHDRLLLQEQIFRHSRKAVQARKELAENSRKYTLIINQMQNNVSALEKELAGLRTNNTGNLELLLKKLDESRSQADEMSAIIERMKNQPNSSVSLKSENSAQIKTEKIISTEPQDTDLARRLTRIQERIRAIQSSIDQKNQTIRALRQDISSIQGK